MNNNNNNYLTLEYIFITSMLIALSGMILIYAVSYYFAYDGFSLVEGSFIQLIIFMITLLSTSALLFLSLKKYTAVTAIKHIKKRYYIGGIFLLSAVFIFLIDVFMHAVVDQTLSVRYAEMMMFVSKHYHQPMGKSMEQISRIPFVVQNALIIIAGLLFGNVLSVVLFNRYQKEKSSNNLQIIS